jgi:sugar phosphate permease
LKFDTIQTNLLTIPSTVIGMSGLIFCAYLSEMVNSRVLATVLLQFWALPLLIALYTFDQNTSRWVYYTVVSLITGATCLRIESQAAHALTSGYPYIHPIQGEPAHDAGYS